MTNAGTNKVARIPYMSCSAQDIGGMNKSTHPHHHHSSKRQWNMWREYVKPEFRADSKVVMIGVCPASYGLNP